MSRKKSDKAKDRARLATVRDYEKEARRLLSKMAYDYYRSGADAERALERNAKAFERFVIWYRVLVDVSQRDLSSTVLGFPVRIPILIAPTAYHKMAHPDGELATARAAEAAGTIMVASTLATTSLEEIAEATAAPKWFQLYVHKDRAFTESLVRRAESAGYEAIVVTVDTPLLGRRLRDERNRFDLPAGLHMANLIHPEEPRSELAKASAAPEAELIAEREDKDDEPTKEEKRVLKEERSLLSSYVADRHDAAFTWQDLSWLKSLSHLPIVLKGVMRADDAARAAAAGVSGIIVSNHGGRQLDGAPATLDALSGVVRAVEDRCEVYMDGGIRWGEDVFKALALGARAVLVGRPILWGLTVGGEQGVVDVLRILTSELSRTMALAGCSSVTGIDRTMVVPG